MKKLIAFTLILVCVLSLSGCNNKAKNTQKNGKTIPEINEVISENNDIPPEGSELNILDYENNPLNSGRGFHGTFPNGLRPMIMVNGKHYRWANRSAKLHKEGSKVYHQSGARTFLPEGFTAIGEISGITEEVPSEELQFRAAFEASGTVFTNEQIPEVIYIQITTPWCTDDYIRFVTDALHDNECISYHGNLYRINPDFDICELIKELPENCIQVGALKYIGDNTIPVNDLETNCIADSYSYILDGREVYADPNDDSLLYVFERQYWAGGDYPAWNVCKLWSEFE